SCAKEISDLKSAIKTINTIVDNWYGYIIKIIARKLDNPEYCSIALVLPSYKPKI
ncbi:3858_t:CDS:2, partial [Cetraspora pellucida]